MRGDWLDSAVFYEIYPTSFYDANGDGVGDIPGIIEKLPYVADLGCNAVWLNPCFCSPFLDGGYDITDYYRVDPRFGTNDDLRRLFETAKALGIRVLLDLVMGHTSDQHPWFAASCKEERNEFTDAYIWSDNLDAEHCEARFICGRSERPHMYKVNYYATQPALNYGYYRPTKSWQMPMDAPAALQNRERLKDVCAFWLDMGAAGFRVDMAHNMVKGDVRSRGNIRFWREVLDDLHARYPDAVFLPEWNDPQKTIGKAGFDLAFYYPFGYTKANGSDRDDAHIYEGTYISEQSRLFSVFLVPYLHAVRKINRIGGYQSLHLDNHDTIRLSRSRSDDMIRVLWASYMTLPGVPLIYYGDELGMRYQPLKSKDGGYQRTGARTPMQWDNTKNNGFSAADGDLYLPVEGPDSPYTVAAEAQDPHSIYNTVKTLAHYKRSFDCLRAHAPLQVLHTGHKKDGNPFIYRRKGRDGTLVVVLQPRKAAVRVPMRKYLRDGAYDCLLLQNADWDGQTLACSGVSFALFYKKA